MEVEKIRDVADAYTLRNTAGMSITVYEYGATLTSVQTPSKSGVQELTLGFSNRSNYFGEHPYFGATVGRYAGRIAMSYFSLEGLRFTLNANEGNNHLHGGITGLSRRIWKAQLIQEQDSTTVQFYYKSPDGEEGYPGTLDLYSSYTLNEDNELTLTFRAKSDAATVLNLCNHTYWNLGSSDTVLDHEVCIHADEVLEIDDERIPSGRLLSVEGNPFDFRSPKPIRKDFETVRNMSTLGYDHCFAVRDWKAGRAAAILPVADVWEPNSGRSMSISSTLPGLQFYTGNTLTTLETNRPCKPYAAFCMESQFYPDSVHHASFPSVILQKDDEFYHQTVHKFSW